MGSHDHQRLLAEIGAALGLAGPYPESVPPEGDPASPGRRVVVGIEDGTGRVGWIEEATESTDRRSPPTEFTINVAGGGSPRWRTDLYTYNPYFGCHVHLIRFFGDALVVVYTEKHGPRVAWAEPSTGERRNSRIGNAFAISGDLLVHTHEYQDVVYQFRLSDLAPAVPLPVAPPPERPHRIELEIGDGTVRWIDRVPLPPSERGRDWRVLRSGRLRLPGPTQRSFPANRETLWARLRELLDDADAPADGSDILIATAGLPFWSPRQDMSVGRDGSGPPIWWFAIAYHLFLREGAEAGEAARWPAWLDRVGAGSETLPEGWDPAWSAAEGAAQLALAHIRVRAAQLARVCHDGARLDYPFWFGWADGTWRHPVPLTEFPEAFVRAWERVPPRFFPGGSSSGL